MIIFKNLFNIIWQYRGIATASLIISFLVLFKLYPIEIIPGEKYIFYRTLGDIIDAISFSSLFFSFALTIAIVILPLFFCQKWAKFQVILLCVLTFFANLFIYNPLIFGWTLRVYSFPAENGVINPFYARGMKVEKLFRYPQEHVVHAQNGYLNSSITERRLTTYPPGLVMIHKIVKFFALSSPKLSSLAIVLAGADLAKIDESISDENKVCAVYSALFYMFCLSVIPFLIFCIAKVLKISSQIAMRIASISALIPSLHLYASMECALIAPLGAINVLSLLYGICKRNRYTIFISGFISGLALFFAYSLLPVIFVSFLLILFSFKYFEFTIASTIQAIFFWIIGLLMFFAIAISFNYNPLLSFFSAMQNNHIFYKSVNRGYLISLVANLVESILFFSPSLFFLFCYINFLTFRKLLQYFNTPSTIISKTYSVLFVYINAIFITIILLFLLGVLRGETGRNLLPLMILSLPSLSLIFFSKKIYIITAIIVGIHLLVCSISLDVIFGLWA